MLLIKECVVSLKEKAPQNSFSTFLLLTSTKSFMTHPLNIIFDYLGI